MEVRLSRGLFARQRRERERRERFKGAGINELLSNKSDTLNVLAPYKVQPDILPFTGDKRRIPRSCKTCVQIDREEDNKGDDEAELGLGNCFHLQNRNPSQPYFRRLFAEVYHYWDYGGRANIWQNLVVANDILNYPKFKSMNQEIQDSSFSSLAGKKGIYKDNPIEVAAKSTRAVEYFINQFGIQPVKLWLHRLLIRFGGWVFSKIFNSVFDGICYHKGALKLLKVATESGLPIIYVCGYKSCLDSYILQWFFLTSGVTPLPLIIEPKSLITSPFINMLSKFMGGLGAFSIGKEHKHRNGFYDHNTNMALYSYIRMSLLKRNSLQVMLESRRSRSGKPSCFIVGGELLNAVIDLHNQKELEDAYIVPLSISYEKLPEEHILDHAQSEFTQTHYNKTLTLLQLLSSYLGYARVNLSQPFRLRDFKLKRSYGNYGSTLNDSALPIDGKSTSLLPGSELQWDEEAGSVASVSSIYGEPDPFYQVEIDSTQYYDEDDYLKAFSQQVYYDALKSTSFMSTNMVSFLLLKKFRGGATMEVLVNEMKALRSVIYSRKRDVTFTGSIELATERAIKLLGNSIIEVSKTKDGQKFLKAVISTSSLIKLGYYSNCLVQLFMREACISTAIFGQFGWTYKTLLGTSYSLSISEGTLVNSSVEVCQLMKGEFIFNPPCKSTEEVIRETIEIMNDYSLISIHKKKGYSNYEDFVDSDDDEDGGTIRGLGKRSDISVYVEKIEFINEEEVWETHEFLRSLVVPYLEFFRAGVTVLKRLVPHDDYLGEKEEIELRQEILIEAKELMKSSKFFNAEEIITVDTARNFLYHMASMKIIDSYSNDETKGKRLFFLTNQYCTEKQMNELLYIILKYITY